MISYKDYKIYLPVDKGRNVKIRARQTLGSHFYIFCGQNIKGIHGAAPSNRNSTLGWSYCHRKRLSKEGGGVRAPQLSVIISCNMLLFLFTFK